MVAVIFAIKQKNYIRRLLRNLHALFWYPAGVPNLFWQKNMQRTSPANNWRDYYNIQTAEVSSIRGTIWIAVALKIKFIRIPTSYSIKQNQIVGRVLSDSQVISLLAIAFFTYSNICQLWRILLRYLFLIFVSSLPSKLISITLQSHFLQ